MGFKIILLELYNHLKSLLHIDLKFTEDPKIQMNSQY
jgi:hypothetical protein